MCGGGFQTPRIPNQIERLMELDLAGATMLARALLSVLTSGLDLARRP